MEFLREAARAAKQTISHTFKLSNASMSNLASAGLDGKVFFSEHVPMNGHCAFETLLQSYKKVEPQATKTAQNLRDMTWERFNQVDLVLQSMILNEHGMARYDAAARKKADNLSLTSSDRSRSH
jgi:hypothetical protein